MSNSIAITSGKGGVGKTTISVNLSIAYKKLLNHVLLLDTDLGMANSHVLLGINPKYSLSNVLNGAKQLNEIIEKTESGVELVSGGTATSELLNLENEKRFLVLNEIDKYLDKFENVKLIVDVAAGAEDNAVVFANACGRIVVVVIGEPTSVVDSYSLIKTINQKSSFKNFCILINQAENSSEANNLFKKFQKITARFLDVNLHYVGFLNDSKKIKKSIIERKPILITEPTSQISDRFMYIANEILKTPKNGDFRVQEEHGGILKAINKPESSLIDFGNKVMGTIPYQCLFSRVDVVRGSNNYLLMEVELIEPSLYFNMDSKSPQMFAEIFNKWHG